MIVKLLDKTLIDVFAVGAFGEKKILLMLENSQ
jgi:hypothetical protein